jgi:hypothetical protein
MLEQALPASPAECFLLLFADSAYPVGKLSSFETWGDNYIT